MAAATEGYLLGVPSMAVSLVGKEARHFETAGRVARMLGEKLLNRPMGQPVLLNVNVPDVPFEEQETNARKNNMASVMNMFTNLAG